MTKFALRLGRLLSVLWLFTAFYFWLDFFFLCLTKTLSVWCIRGAPGFCRIAHLMNWVSKWVWDTKAFSVFVRSSQKHLEGQASILFSLPQYFYYENSMSGKKLFSSLASKQPPVSDMNLRCLLSQYLAISAHVTLWTYEWQVWTGRLKKRKWMKQWSNSWLIC